VADEFRYSPHIDFDSGLVKNTPETLINEMIASHTPDEKLDLFECRVDVWQLGVAVEILKQVEDNEPPSIWSHAAYGLVTLTTSYFEMVGKILNPVASPWKGAEREFNMGFCDVYPEYIPEDGNMKKVRFVDGLRGRMRNGMFHLGYTKRWLIIHNGPEIERDFQPIRVQKPGGGYVQAYCVNPHKMTRTIVNHFPSVIDRIRKSRPDGLWKSFLNFYDDLHDEQPEALLDDQRPDAKSPTEKP
jgi:hypothetical protein